MKACIPSAVLGFRGVEGVSAASCLRLVRQSRSRTSAMTCVWTCILCVALLMGGSSIALAQTAWGLSQTTNLPAGGAPGGARTKSTSYSFTPER